MKIYNCFIVTILFVALNTSFAFANNVNAKVLSVHDGDTITVLVGKKKKVKLRLDEIDAPELSQYYGTESRNHLSSLLKNKKILYKSNSEDKYGRTLATIYVDNENINYKMVADGYAWHYKAYSKSYELAKAEDRAKAVKIGLWKEANPTPPWAYRRTEKTQEEVAKANICINIYKFDLSFRKSCPQGSIAISVSLKWF